MLIEITSLLQKPTESKNSKKERKAFSFHSWSLNLWCFAIINHIPKQNTKSVLNQMYFLTCWWNHTEEDMLSFSCDLRIPDVTCISELLNHGFCWLWRFHRVVIQTSRSIKDFLRCQLGRTSAAQQMFFVWSESTHWRQQTQTNPNRFDTCSGFIPEKHQRHRCAENGQLDKSI